MTGAVGQHAGLRPGWPGSMLRSRMPDVAATPLEFDDAVTWAAWLYYVDQLTQSAIASRLGVSRASIVNYLQEARERGLVTIRMDTEVAGRTALALRLREAHGLEGALIIPADGGGPITPRLGEAGARARGGLVRDGDTLGVAWGQTMLAMAETIHLPAPRERLTVVQVSGSSTADAHFSPELCTSLLARRVGARCINLLAPAVLSTRALKRTIMAEPVLVRQFELIHSANIIVFGVGDVGPSSTMRRSGIATEAEADAYVARGAVAVVIGRFIDGAGQAVTGELDDRMVGIELSDLKQVPVRLCVAGGPAKLEAIRATLQGGYASHLVTDDVTARRLVEN